MRVVDTLWGHVWSKHRKLTLILSFEWFFLVLYGIMSYLYMADFIQLMVNQSLVMTPDSALFEMWQNPPVQPEMSIYLFNYTNVEDWMNGKVSKLHVEECGPYVYQEIWKKKNVSFHDDDTVSFDLFKEYHYLPEKSKGNAKKDVIITPNIPLFSAGSSMKDAGYFTLMGFKATINTVIGDEALPVFVARTVDELMWGYDDKLTELGRTFMPSDSLKSDQFGLLAGKNFSVDGRVRVHTGKGNLNMLGQIQSFNGKDKYNVWSDKRCDQIKGGDGSFMSPNLDMNSKVEITVVDMCRTIRLIPTKPVTVGHLHGLRFVPEPDLFNYEAVENKCYCPSSKMDEAAKVEEEDDEEEGDGYFDDFAWFGKEEEEQKAKKKAPSTKNKCTGNGVYHLGPCKFGAPLATSWPHFLASNPRIDTVTGINPDPEQHNFFMDFQPEMGIGMRAFVRLQFNLKMEKSKAFPQLSALPIDNEYLVPIMWFQDVIEAPPENLQILLKDAISAGPNLAINSTIIAFTGLTMQIIVYFCYLLWSYHKDTT